MKSETHSQVAELLLGKFNLGNASADFLVLGLHLPEVGQLPVQRRAAQLKDFA